MSAGIGGLQICQGALSLDLRIGVLAAVAGDQADETPIN